MDWNEDGKKDLLVGDSDGLIHIFLNTGADAEPVLAAGELLEVGGEIFQPSERLKPDVVDWNNDGKKDIIFGLEDGEVFLLNNTGTNAEPIFEKATPIKDGDKPLKAGMRNAPCVYDWNADGKKDLLFADESSNVIYFENKGTDAEPLFNGAVAIEADGESIAGGYRSRLDITDWNNDGQPDLLYGFVSREDNRGYIHLYLAQK